MHVDQECASRVVEDLLREAASVMERLEHGERRVLAVILRRDGAIRVDELFPGFRRGGGEHEILRVLRRRQLVGPDGNGAWRPDKDIVLKRLGRLLVSLDRSDLLAPWLGG